MCQNCDTRFILYITFTSSANFNLRSPLWKSGVIPSPLFSRTSSIGILKCLFSLWYYVVDFLLELICFFLASWKLLEKFVTYDVASKVLYQRFNSDMDLLVSAILFNFLINLNLKVLDLALSYFRTEWSISIKTINFELDYLCTRFTIFEHA